VTPRRRQTQQARAQLATLAREPRERKPLLYSSRHGDCDGCGKFRNLARIVWIGMDTDQCWECRGVDPDEDDNECDVAELFSEEESSP
jgi:hypothetical protein